MLIALSAGAVGMIRMYVKKGGGGEVDGCCLNGSKMDVLRTEGGKSCIYEKRSQFFKTVIIV